LKEIGAFFNLFHGLRQKKRRYEMLKKPWKKEEMRRHRALGAVFAAVFLIGLVVAFGSIALAADPEVIKLKFSTSFMPPEPPNVQAMHTLDAVEKKTNGRVKIERHLAGALGGPKEQLGLVKSGAVDIISLHIDQYPQDLPLHQITNTEQLVTNAQGVKNVTAIIQEIPETKKLFEAEQKKNNIKVLYFHANGPTGLTPRFAAKSLADLKGKKVNVITAFQRDVFKEMGWIPVNVAIPELYEGLSRGVIDCIFMATAAVLPLKWNEVGKSHLYFGDNTVISTPLAFNLDTWNKLPKDIQQAFLDASRETAQWSIQENDNFLKATYGAFEKAGAPPVRVSDAERARFFTILFKHQEANNRKIAKAAGVEKEQQVIQKVWNEMKWGKWKGK
jgi:TRAP-type C4-dicarboxylate transport system substrate-binding protein